VTLDLTGMRVTVMGLGSRGGGVGVTRYLATHGAVVTVTDGKRAAELAEPLAELEGLPIQYVLGEHREESFTPAGADMVVRNPAVRRNSPWLALARSTSVPVEMEMSLFLQRCPAPVIGVTGTKGKSTTSALCGEMLRRWRDDAVIAGNMGVSALAQLDRVTPDTPVLLEISSWQLEGMDEHRIGPRIAVLTNISQDHLDAYDSFAEYAECKRSIARHLRSDDVLVVNAADPLAWEATGATRARVVPFSAAPLYRGVWACDGRIVWALEEGSGEVALPDRPWLRGAPLIRNAAAAVGAAIARGVDSNAIAYGLEAFTGIANRSEVVAIVDGISFINDTAATAPAATVAALEALQGTRAHVLAGGADKRTDLVPLADVLAHQAASVSLLDGTATPVLRGLLEERKASITGVFNSMAEAVAAARAEAVAGDVVLLSPGCASFGLFRDEFDRGEQFRQVVRTIESAEGDRQ
jgi:UDP-N-acetylmuramoylalanine--D-glutamate ligase